MKYYTLILLSIFALLGCTDNPNDDFTLVKSYAVATEASTYTDSWTNHDFCCLNQSQDSVKAPWAENDVVTTIPSEIRKDVKEEDGWAILYSSMRINGYNRDYNYQHTDKSANYIIFYNRYNGMLKGFCYLPAPVQQNNMALWHISTNDSTRLFNFAGEEAIPYNGPKSKDVYISNITNEKIAKGFNNGWNCFQIELAYDADSPSQTLNIDAITLNEASYNFTGTMGFSSDGVIITTTQKPQNNILKGAATAIGDAAKNYIEKNFETNGNSTRGVVATTVGSLVAAGANKIFSSIFGKSSSTTSEQTISIKSKGEVTLKGNSIQPATGIITPVSDIPLNKLGYALGIWNILDYPYYQTEEYAALQNYFSTSNDYAFRYTINTSAYYQKIVNPNQGSTSMSADIVYKGFYTSNNCYLETKPKQIYTSSNSLPSLYSMPYNFRVVYASQKYLPKKKSSYDKPYIDLEADDNNINKLQDVDISIKQHLYNNGGDFLSTKTFPAKKRFKASTNARPYWWTLKELEASGYKTNQ